MKYENITSDILKYSFKIHKKLGFEFLEEVYYNALVYELEKATPN